MEFHKAVGALLKEKKNSCKWSANELARKLTIQQYRNLPYGDRPDFFNPSDKSDQKDPLYDSNTSTTLDEEIHNYIENKYKLPENQIKINGVVRSLDIYISEHTVNAYINGKTPIPTLVIISLCQLLESSPDSFFLDVYDRLGIKKEPVLPIKATKEITLEQAFNTFFKKAFGDRKDNRYIFDTSVQGDLLSSLFTNRKNTKKLYFTYLPTYLGQTDKDQKEVIFQRGELTFNIKDGMCHVTSKVLTGPQEISREYKGFAIIMNPNSDGTTCTCFLREVNNTFGVFIIFTFRLSPIEKPPRQTRISECMSVRNSDGTPFVYRLLLSENLIADEQMKYFIGHLKLGTSENTSDRSELNILIREQYIKIAKKFFEGIASDGTEKENAVYEDLKNHFGEADHKCYIDILRLLEQTPNRHIDEMRSITPKIFDKHDEKHLLFFGWLGKLGLSARHDKVGNKLDDAVENIHKSLYPDLHASKTRLHY